MDGNVYGSIVPGLGGFATQQERLKLENVDAWKGGSTMAPFDKEASFLEVAPSWITKSSIL